MTGLLHGVFTGLLASRVGVGWSSIVVAGERCITQEQRSELECVTCYHLLTGEELWVHSDKAAFREITGGDGPRASPCSDGSVVVTLGATGLLNCLSVETGDVRWSVRVPAPSAIELVFGLSGSPLIVGKSVFVSTGASGKSLQAYDLNTGRELWAEGKSAPSYASPQLADFNLGRHILNFGGDAIVGHAPDDGRVLWSHPFGERSTEFVNVCQPVPLPNDRVLVSAGYGRGSTMFQLEKSKNGIAAQKLWHNLKLKSKFSSIVTRDSYAYGLDEQILTCIELETGNRQWKAGRYGHGQLILVGDCLLVLAESGDVVLVDANPDRHMELGRSKALSNRCWTHPVLAGSLLLVRSDREAACFALETTNTP